MASLAETALRSPSTINNMFIVNGDGTYTVRFYQRGNAEYVTVDDYLPTNGSGNAIYAGMGKQLCQLVRTNFGSCWPKRPLSSATNLAGSAQASQATDRTHIPALKAAIFMPRPATSRASRRSPLRRRRPDNFTTFVNAWNAGKLDRLRPPASPASSTVVGGHAYAVIGYNSSNQTITLYNPWGPNYAYAVTMTTWSQIGEPTSPISIVPPNRSRVARPEPHATVVRPCPTGTKICHARSGTSFDSLEVRHRVVVTGSSGGDPVTCLGPIATLLDRLISNPPTPHHLCGATVRPLLA